MALAKSVENKELTSGNTNNVVSISGQDEDVCVGIDDGRFGIKLVTKSGQWFVPSRVSSGANAMSLSDSDDTMYEIPGTNERYTVSDQVASMDMRFPEYPVSAVNRVLVHHALIKAGLGGKRVRIVSGLPIDEFFLANVENIDLIKKKTESLRDHEVINMNSEVPCAKITKAAVVSEAIAAFWDLLYDDNGQRNSEFEELINTGPIAIVDIGGQTTDIAVVENGGRRVDSNRSGSAYLGALSLNAAIEQQLKQKFNCNQLNPNQVRVAIETGTFRLFGKGIDCSDLVGEEKKKLAEQIVHEIKRRIRDGADLERIYFVGGGSLLLQEELKALYPHSEFVADPQFANARGMWKIATLHLAKQ